MIVLNNEPGLASVVVNALDAPMAIQVDGWNGFFGFKAIITDLQFQLESQVGFQQSALDLTYIYSFGDRISQLQVAGLAFLDTCLDAGGPTGLENLMAFYMQNRATVRALPAQIHLGSGASGYFQGFLTGFRGGISRPEARLAEFGLIYQVLPRLRGAG